MEKLHELFFVNIFTPVAQHGLKRRRPAGIFGTLAGFLKETEFFHDRVLITAEDTVKNIVPIYACFVEAYSFAPTREFNFTHILK
jgi:hypothetical protein